MATKRSKTVVVGGVVDEDPGTLRFVRKALTDSGFETTVTADSEEALALVEAGRHDLVLLDLILPLFDASSLMRNIIRVSDVSVILFSMCGRDQIIAQALDEGASDYIVKPFSAAELAARVRVALRKRVTPDRVKRPASYVVGGLTIDYAGRRVTVGAIPVALTPTEFE